MVSNKQKYVSANWHASQGNGFTCLAGGILWDTPSNSDRL